MENNSNTSAGNINYLYVQPDSHFFDDINQIIQTLKYQKVVDKQHLIKGLENTIKQGYNIRKVNEES